MLKRVKRQDGFTLVEVIVVAVIVAVLAAVAIPLYNGYVRDSRKNVADNTAGTIASALAATRQQGIHSDSIPTAATSNVYRIPGLSGIPNTIRIPENYSVAVNKAESTVIVKYVVGSDSISSRPFKF